MSGGTLPITGTGVLAVGSLAVTNSLLAVIAAATIALGAVLVLSTVRRGWRRGKSYSQP